MNLFIYCRKLARHGFFIRWQHFIGVVMEEHLTESNVFVKLSVPYRINTAISRLPI